ncbi:DNA topoisomerase [Paenibacillus sp. HGF7]|uniref:DNA topoisomerase n=2 Tax=unclassified Paenibacillus TaxID=185978 RepID=UPI0020162333|nr:DNA topoisomerase [Paenibacillus sp. HGF7]
MAEKRKVAMDHLIPLMKESFTRHAGYYESENYIVTWAIGHLLQLSDPEDYGVEGRWNLDQLPIKPKKFTLKPAPIKSKKDQLNCLKTLFNRKDVALIINAADAGREGALIFDEVYSYSKSKKPVKFFWTSSYVLKDLEYALQNMKDMADYSNLISAARCRRDADWLYGINLSRAYSVVNETAPLGRVITPTLALVVERDRKINNFVSEPLYSLKATFGFIPMQYRDKSGQSSFKEKTILQEIETEIVSQTGRIVKVLNTESLLSPPLLYDITDLQTEASQKLGIPVNDVSEILQTLSEGGYISYPRSDSNYLPSSMVEDISDIITGMLKIPCFSETAAEALESGINVSNACFNDDLVTDHYAIIPTGVHPVDLSDQANAVYQMIVRRTLIRFLAPAKFHERELVLECQNHEFFARAKRITCLGWLQHSEYSPASSNLPNFPEGKPLRHQKSSINTSMTRPPQPFTEATLLMAMKSAGKSLQSSSLRQSMDQRGLGTPATQSGIIERLKTTGLIARSTSGHLCGTEKGKKIIENLIDDRIASAEITGEFEYKLKKVEDGELSGAQFMADLSHLVTQYVVSYKNTKKQART